MVDAEAGAQGVYHRLMDMLAQMQMVVMGMVGKRLTYRNLVADNGRSAVAG